MKFKLHENGHNEILVGKGFFISYNPSINSNPFDKVMSNLGLAEYRVGKPETAIVLKKKNPETIYGMSIDREFFILNGDFRKEYEKAFPSLKKCLEIYHKNKAKYGSDFSDDISEKKIKKFVKKLKNEKKA